LRVAAGGKRENYVLSFSSKKIRFTLLYYQHLIIDIIIVISLLCNFHVVFAGGLSHILCESMNISLDTCLDIAVYSYIYFLLCVVSDSVFHWIYVFWISLDTCLDLNTTVSHFLYVCMYCLLHCMSTHLVHPGVGKSTLMVLKNEETVRHVFIATVFT
jgi:hypothetical protein